MYSLYVREQDNKSVAGFNIILLNWQLVLLSLDKYAVNWYETELP